MRSLMEAYRHTFPNSPVFPRPHTVAELAGAVGAGRPVRLSTVLNALEVVHLQKDIITDSGDPINGSVAVTIRGNGTYEFRTSVRATGFPSYHYRLQVFLQSASGFVVAVQRTGDVFGTDSPGDRQENWMEEGSLPLIREVWPTFRSGADIHFRLDAEIGGPTGSAWDVVKGLGKAVLAGAILGPGGALLVVGHEIGTALRLTPEPGTIAGVLVAGGMALVFGPGAMIPAIAVGAAVGAVIAADIKSRALKTSELRLAQQVFGDTIPFDKVLITNLKKEGGHYFTIPSLFDTILVNIGETYYSDASTWADTTRGSDYSQPGSVFIHELVHAWQIARSSFTPGLACEVSHEYDYHPDDGAEGVDRESKRLLYRGWADRDWRSYSLEQQAHIVDDWYGANHADLNSEKAISDPAFRFIRDNIRAARN